ncbi:DUF2190 domain-containing protein [Mycobacterium sp. KBS0706]|uniref:DUF2190 family protein n=1 Tax=Mycobacterium sp. KBS0706 TaxID=2578109 RepID=UPI00110FB537|nr:DUF2190 family protein [Mycobacterium sp. KBS0706]TSD86016.1 DUF2190 domain-containing protein [Mycobacterium sp. KBS0706]
MRNHGLVKPFVAGAIVPPYRIVKFGADDDTAIAAAAAADKSIGVTDMLGASAVGVTFDIVLTGIAEVEYGGPVTRGDDLTADAQGRAVAVAAAGNRVIGKAMATGVLGDIGSVLIDRGVAA